MSSQKKIRAAALMILAGGMIGCAELQGELPAPVSPNPQVHQDGWKGSTTQNFHGNAIRLAGWDLKQCATCHGSSFTGGTSSTSCLTCHNKPGGLENCTTCHGGANSAPPRDLNKNTARTVRTVGAHQPHVLGGLLSENVQCTECHSVPGSINTPGHIDLSPSAEVTFKGRLANTNTNVPGTANYSSTLPLFTPSPSYDQTTATCKNTYCHGTFKNGNTDFAPAWNPQDPASQATCGTCHGDVSKPSLVEKALPKTDTRGGTHPNNTACLVCHADVVDANGKIISVAKHINGKLNLFGQEKDF